jgi:hypothetical protein
MEITYRLDCSTDEFKLKNAAAQRQFRDLCDNYAVYRDNRRDSVLTESRRAGLRGIHVQTRDGVLVYTEMLRLAKVALEAFEREDSRLQMPMGDRRNERG